MKILYNQIKELVPGLKANPKEVGEVLTFTGFMMENFQEIKLNGKKDYLMNLEIRQNRADCFGVIGLAREVAAAYGLKLVLPKIKKYKQVKNKLVINVLAKEKVKSILAIKIDNLENKQSPQWLKDYLINYGMNSISLLVDISNYVMILTGYPSHLIDSEKMTGNLAWEINNSFEEFVSLDNSKIKLNKNELIIRDDKNIIALAGIIGGRSAEVSDKTKSIIAEMAVYDRVIIGKNSRSLHIATEAGNRLEKELDPLNSTYAMEMLIDMILEYSGGEVVSDLYKYNNYKDPKLKIKFDLNLPSKIAGVEIPKKTIIQILKNLNFGVEIKNNNTVLVSIPSYRTDMDMAEDLAEEVIRIFGFQNIPSDQIPALNIVKDITPLNIPLVDKMRDILAIKGFDEIISWPLTKYGDNKKVNYSDLEGVTTQNSVNELFPDLRQSTASGLLNQLVEFDRRGVELVDIFETGKVFGKNGSKYVEYEVIGMLSFSQQNTISIFKEKIETSIRIIGLNNISYTKSKNMPEIANLNSCWDILVDGKFVGVLYKMIPQEIKGNIYFSELNITTITELVRKNKNNPTVEITTKLIVLDANVELSKEESPYAYLSEIQNKLNKDNIWSINIEDAFQTGEKIKYTFRVIYKEMSDQEAKKIHLSAFNLTS